MSGILVIISVFHSSRTVVVLVCACRPRAATVGESRGSGACVLLERVKHRVCIELLGGISIM